MIAELEVALAAPPVPPPPLIDWAKIPCERVPAVTIELPSALSTLTAPPCPPVPPLPPTAMVDA